MPGQFTSVISNDLLGDLIFQDLIMPLTVRKANLVDSGLIAIPTNI